MVLGVKPFVIIVFFFFIFLDFIVEHIYAIVIKLKYTKTSPTYR